MGKPFYGKAKSELMKDCFQKMKSDNIKQFLKEEFIDEFMRKYNRFKRSGVERSLVRLSVNNPSRRIYKPTADDDVLWKIDQKTFKFYKKEDDWVIKAENNIIDKTDKLEKIRKEAKPKTISEQPDEIVKRAMISIQEINNICKNHRKRRIFKPEVFELRLEIEKHCDSRDSFNNFAIKLYILIREYTRYENLKRTPPFDYMLPNNFTRDGRTKEFWDIVNTVRHDYAHGGEGKIADIYEKFLCSRTGPETPEEYQQLQIGILNQFENAMNDLLDMIKNDPSILKK